VSAGTFHAVCVTALVCIGAGVAYLCYRERRHERQALRRDEQWREAMWQRETGASPPVLTDADRAEFKAIASRLKRQDAGLGILSSDRSES
jgi:hypothetical protein